MSTDSDKKTLGIIGGMGPLATADLFYKIIEHTDAHCDSGHIHIVIDNNPKIPDRTKAVLEGSDAPFAYILEAAERLERMGADILLLPCNTSHVFYQKLCGAIHVPVLNMIEETAREVHALGLKSVGVLATTGALRARLYENALNEFGIKAVLPSEGGQAEVMSVIYNGVKAGAENYDTAAFTEELKLMAAGGAEYFVLGCTELPVAFEKYRIDLPFIDPALILAKAAIAQAGYAVK